MLIDKEYQLKNLCRSISEKNITQVCLDTEFIRQSTYWPKFCLLQLGFEGAVVAIDPLALDISPLFPILQDPKILKIIHSGRQDLEIFFHEFNFLPTPLVDTQIAAALTSHGDSVGYDTLIQHYFGKTLDKSIKMTDWEQRPLSATQIEYALNDVRYLIPLYEILRKELENVARISWLPDIINSELLDISTYKIDPEEAWKKIKLEQNQIIRPTEKFHILKKLAAWRELEAQRLNLNRTSIIGDVDLDFLAFSKLKSDEKAVSALDKIKDKIPLESLPSLRQTLKENIEEINMMPGISFQHLKKHIKPLTSLVQNTAKELGIPSRFLAKKTWLEFLVHSYKDGIPDQFSQHPLLSGWRYEIIGQKLIDELNKKS